MAVAGLDGHEISRDFPTKAKVKAAMDVYLDQMGLVMPEAAVIAAAKAGNADGKPIRPVAQARLKGLPTSFRRQTMLQEDGYKFSKFFLDLAEVADPVTLADLASP
jgi:hypothetical protein